MNPDYMRIIGVICGVRMEDVLEQKVREIRYLDNFLAHRKAMDEILRIEASEARSSLIGYRSKLSLDQLLLRVVSMLG